MESGRFEVFDTDADSMRIRWFDGDAPMRDRRLAPREVDDLVALVNERYRSLSPQLEYVGADLYRWLDGPTERWLATARAREKPMTILLDCEARLRHLPWELLHDGNTFLTSAANNPLCPVRLASNRTSDAIPPTNRPLRVLFMATSPSNVEPVLDFEHEEAVILAAAGNNLELIVEESGSLAGLRWLLAYYGAGYFDVLHLSGHALVTADGPRFVFEDDVGLRADASVAELTDAIGPRWPRLVFLSGCHTGRAGDDGELASMAEALVEAGAPAVLGWALPVGDQAATSLARSLYEELAAGADCSEAVASSRRSLSNAQSAYWHLLRLFADRRPLTAHVTPAGHAGRARIVHRPASTLFLDNDRKVRVASGAAFVGRRRDLQRCLRTLRSNDPSLDPNVLLIHGMGGLGKSTLTARLLDRLRPTHPNTAVWIGAVDDAQARTITEKVQLDAQGHLEANELLSNPKLSLKERLRFVLAGPMASVACLFVLDDFEKNLEPDGLGGFQCSPAGLEVLDALASAINATSSPSRLIITSRYDFPLPVSISTVRVPLGALRDADLAKKLRLTKNLHRGSTLTDTVRGQAVDASAGIPRLIEWLDDLVGDQETDHQALVAAILRRTVEFRESVLAETLLSAQASTTRRMLAHAAIFELPVPHAAIAALLPNEDIGAPLARAVAVGLIEAVSDPVSGEQRYFVSGVVKPLLEDIEEALTDDQRQAGYSTAARTLYELWV